MKKVITSMIFMITLASLAFAQTVTETDLTGKWTMVKRASFGYEETENGNVDKIYFNDEKITNSMMEAAYKEELTPVISSYDLVETLIIESDSSGRIEQETLINGLRAVIDYGNDTWENSSEMRTVHFEWSFQHGILTVLFERETIHSEVTWVEIDSVKYLSIEKLGLYIK